MKAIFRLFVFILLVAGWGLAALSVHVVRTPDQIPITILTKNRLDWRETYTDTTKWTMEDVPRHPLLIERILQTGKSDVLNHVVDLKDGDVQQQLTDALEDGQQREASKRDATREQLARRVFRWPWEQRKL